MWSPQNYLVNGLEQGHDRALLETAIRQIEVVKYGPHSLPGLLSLKHLAIRSTVPYTFLRKVVERKSPHDIYRKFSIKKRSGGRRFIHIPSPELMRAQKWVNHYILSHIQPHESSYAFSKGSSILRCATRHAGAEWLIKMDIMGFFESISEIQVSRVFKDIGYQPLMAFELARITTVPVLGPYSVRRSKPNWRVNKRNQAIPSYNTEILGYLPQGAPTSPLISNLVMKKIDCLINDEARKLGLTYTRYSDDLTFSTRNKKFTRGAARIFIKKISRILAKNGFEPQHRKTSIVPPGSRKIVLGLQVNGPEPKLTREYKDNLRQHLYYLEKYGPMEHAIARGFESVWGMKSHLKGLIDHSKMVEPTYAKETLDRFNSVDWPV